MPQSAPKLQSVPLVATRWCPCCRDYLLEPVTGGLGKMGRCAGCGYTGPLQIDASTAAQVAETRREWSRQRLERIARVVAERPSRDEATPRRCEADAHAPARRRTARSAAPAKRPASPPEEGRPSQCP